MSKIEQLDNALIDAADFQAPELGANDQSNGSLRLTRGHWALIVVALLCLLFIGFISVARSVQITTVTPSLNNPDTLLPQQADVEIANWVKLPIGNRVLVLPGLMNVSVEAEGFTSTDSSIDIDSERHQQHQIILYRLPGKLDIQLSNQLTKQKIQPEFLKASVQIDGQTVAGLPGLIKGVAAGQHTVTVDAPLYRATTSSVIVQGKDETQTLQLSLQPAWAEYTFTTQPSGATINVDGQDLGITPLTIRLEEGTRQLAIKAQGYKAFEQEVSVVAQEDLSIPEISLIPADGFIDVKTKPENAAVILNGEYRGIAPLSIAVAPNQTQKLQVYKAGFQLYEQDLSLKPDQHAAENVELAQDRVAVSFSVSPSDAQIYVDGVRRGQGSQTLNLTTLPHKVSVRKAGYVSYNLDLIPTRGSTQIVRAKLLTKEQQFWAQLPNQYTNRLGHELVLFKSPGAVQLGSSRREDGRRANEVVYTAQLNKHFYVSRHETTNKQFRAFKKNHSSGNYKRKSLDSGKQPVVNVSWQEAALYCNWLSKQEKLEPFYQIKSGFVWGNNENANGYRLLTEVEWAWLARNKSSQKGSQTLTYPWGSQLDGINSKQPVGNFADQNAEPLVAFTLPDYNDGYAAAAPVGKFSANHRGIFDLGGNVSEWVNDWYSAKGNLAGKASNYKVPADPLGPEEGEFHVVRGASWAKGHPPQLRLAYRDFGAKGKYDIGFRIARYVSPPK